MVKMQTEKMDISWDVGKKTSKYSDTLHVYVIDIPKNFLPHDFMGIRIISILQLYKQKFITNILNSS